MSEEEGNVASQLPKPSGYKILIALPEPEKEFDGGIIKASKTLYDEEIGSIVGVVLALGPDCYADPNRFPNGPYCKEGDCILMRSYSRERVSFNQ